MCFYVSRLQLGLWEPSIWMLCVETSHTGQGYEACRFSQRRSMPRRRWRGDSHHLHAQDDLLCCLCVDCVLTAGDQDLICNWLGNRRWVDGLEVRGRLICSVVARLAGHLCSRQHFVLVSCCTVHVCTWLHCMVARQDGQVLPAAKALGAQHTQRASGQAR